MWMVWRCVFQVFKDLFDDMMYSEGFSLRPVLLHPQTRGVVRLRSTDPTDHPYIEPNYLAHPDDIKILVEGTRRPGFVFICILIFLT